MSTNRRRRSQPWIHRWSRVIIGTIAIIGAILTAYLAITKLTGGEVACSADAAASAGCSDVLNTRYATVFGLPLSLFGCLGYLAMTTFALSPLAIKPDSNITLRKQLEEYTWIFLLIGSVAMATFSGYLMYLLAFEIKQLCLYCIASATFALSMLVLTVIGKDWEDIGQIFFTGAIVSVVTLIGTLAIYSTPSDLTPISLTELEKEPVAPYGWEINMTSGAAETALAKHLTQTGAKMYGAYWCPHCYEQKQLFGKEAWQEVNYVECAEGGKNAQPDACSKAGIKSFPTWEIQGKLDPGAKVMSKLAEASGYQGDRTFKYRLR